MRRINDDHLLLPYLLLPFLLLLVVVVVLVLVLVLVLVVVVVVTFPAAVVAFFLVLNFIIFDDT